MRYYLSRFDHIAVREPSTVNVLKEQFNVDAVNVVDPFYLISDEDFDYLAAQSTEHLYKDHIVAYILTPDQSYKEQLDILSQKLGCDVVIVTQFYEVEKFRDFGFKNVIAPEIEGWVNHIKHARMVITDSFHAMYAIIRMKKHFFVITSNQKDFKRGEARFQIFSKIPALEKRMLGSIDEISKFDGPMNDINYDEIHAVFDQQKEFSIRWLNDALSAPKQYKKSVESESLAILQEKLDLINEKIKHVESCAPRTKAPIYKVKPMGLRFHIYRLLSHTFGKLRAHYKKKKDSLRDI